MVVVDGSETGGGSCDGTVMEVMWIATGRLLFCPWSFLRFCVDMVVVLVLCWCCALVFLCVVCRKNGVVMRNYLSLGGAVGPDY